MYHSRTTFCIALLSLAMFIVGSVCGTVVLNSRCDTGTCMDGGVEVWDPAKGDWCVSFGSGSGTGCKRAEITCTTVGEPGPWKCDGKYKHKLGGCTITVPQCTK
jgi:hypothetical protein